MKNRMDSAKKIAGQVAVSGYGTISCLGLGTEALWSASMKGHTGIKNGVGVISPELEAHLRLLFDPKSQLTRSALFAKSAIEEAMRKAQWQDLTKDDGFILATTTGQIEIWEKSLLSHFQNPKPSIHENLRFQSLGSLEEALRKEFQFLGKSLLITSACTAATQAIAMANLWIKTGKVRRCLVGGVETLSTLTLEGFRSLQLLSQEACRPFDQNRQGINLSEGAAFLCLEESDHKAMPKDLRPWISGFGFSSDAFHMTSPHPQGKGSEQSMRKALATAKLEPGEISWIHAHGTGSKANDQSEGNAIYEIFSNSVPVSSTKYLHGHSLAASGALESVLCLEALKYQKPVPSWGLNEPDLQIPLKSYQMRNEERMLHHVLKNTLGFGGNNASLIFSRAPA